MNLSQIKSAVKAGQVVHWATDSYVVKYNEPTGQFCIVCTANGHTIGLTWRDGVTLNGHPSEFYVQPIKGTDNANH